jgi:hypothetical protein
MGRKEVRVMTDKKKVVEVETAEQQLVPALRVIKTYPGGEKYAACAKCGVKLVNVEERIKCKFCWNCGTPVKWR